MARGQGRPQHTATTKMVVAMTRAAMSMAQMRAMATMLAMVAMLVNIYIYIYVFIFSVAMHG